MRLRSNRRAAAGDGDGDVGGRPGSGVGGWGEGAAEERGARAGATWASRRGPGGAGRDGRARRAPGRTDPRRAGSRQGPATAVPRRTRNTVPAEGGTRGGADGQAAGG
jgi:hypothetical protein